VAALSIVVNRGAAVFANSGKFGIVDILASDGFTLCITIRL